MREYFGKKNTRPSDDNVIKTKHWMALKSERRKIGYSAFKNNPKVFFKIMHKEERNYDIWPLKTIFGF